jgi:hypothetical protein
VSLYPTGFSRFEAVRLVKSTSEMKGMTVFFKKADRRITAFEVVKQR